MLEGKNVLGCPHCNGGFNTMCCPTCGGSGQVVEIFMVIMKKVMRRYNCLDAEAAGTIELLSGLGESYCTIRILLPATLWQDRIETITPPMEEVKDAVHS